MNVFGLFKSISPPSEGDNNNPDAGNRHAVEGSGQGKSRKNGLDVETSIHDWYNPRRRERQVVARFNQAMKRLEKISHDL